MVILLVLTIPVMLLIKPFLLKRDYENSPANIEV